MRRAFWRGLPLFDAIFFGAYLVVGLLFRASGATPGGGTILSLLRDTVNGGGHVFIALGYGFGLFRHEEGSWREVFGYSALALAVTAAMIFVFTLLETLSLPYSLSRGLGFGLDQALGFALGAVLGLQRAQHRKKDNPLLKE